MLRGVNKFVRVILNPFKYHDDDEGGGHKLFMDEPLMLSNECWEIEGSNEAYSPQSSLIDVIWLVESDKIFVWCLKITAYAKDARKFQYIFLTPLSIESVGTDEDIQIVQIQKNSG